MKRFEEEVIQAKRRVSVKAQGAEKLGCVEKQFRAVPVGPCEQTIESQGAGPCRPG